MGLNDKSVSDQENKDDYLGLYKHFEDTASNVKGAMFKNLTWIFGIASGLLAFIYSYALKEPITNPQIPFSQVSILILFAGVFICIYAVVSIFESAHHIKSNWDMAEKCKSKVPALVEVIGAQVISNEAGWLYGVMICRRLFWVAIGYGLAFIYTFFLIMKSV